MSKSNTVPTRIQRKAKVANRNHSALAKKTLIFYAGKPKTFKADPLSAITDLLVDLQHFCLDNDINFPDTVSTARKHFQYENDPAHAEEIALGI